MITRSIFNDDALESAFRKNGFIKIPFFSPTEVAALSHLCEKLDGSMDAGFTTTIWSNDQNYRKAVYEELKKFYLPHIDGVLKNCKIIMGTILTKRPTLSSGLDIHQDWAFTDEDQFPAVNIWVPLVNTNPTNGALCFLPYSHLFAVPYRGRHVTPQFTNVKDLIWKLGKTCPAAAGEAVIFDVRMVHYSNANTSDRVRTAVSMVAIPDEAPIFHYINYDQAKDQITEMEVNELFYNNFSHDDPIPKGTNFKDFIFHRTQLDKISFEQEYDRIRSHAQKL